MVEAKVGLGLIIVSELYSLRQGAARSSKQVQQVYCKKEGRLKVECGLPWANYTFQSLCFVVES